MNSAQIIQKVFEVTWNLKRLSIILDNSKKKELLFYQKRKN